MTYYNAIAILDPKHWATSQLDLT